MRFRSRIALTVVIPIVAGACGTSSSNTPVSGGSGSGSGSGSSSGSSGSNSGATSGSSSGGSGGGSGASSGSSGSGGSGSGGSSSGGGSAGSSGGSGSGGGSSSSSGSSSGGGGDGGAGGNVVVHLDQTHQTIDGFGLNDTFASASLTSQQATQLFDATNGIGLSILRVGMNSAGNFMNTTVIPADITTAKSFGAKIIGSCWTPPANCKTNGSENDGGHLCSAANGPGTSCTANANYTSCYDSWSTTIANFARTNSLYAMSLANEPDFASCGTSEPCNGHYATTLYTASEMVAFVKVAGPKLKAAGVKVMAPEPSEWNHLWSNQSACCSVPSNLNSSDPLKCGFPPSNAACTSGGGYDYGHYLANDSTAWAALDIMATHEYDSQVASPWPSDVSSKKPVWQTEMAGVKWWAEQGASSDINNGVAVAGWIHSALVTGEASAWLWWWYQPLSGGTNDNEGLILQNGSDTKRHYTLGNYSKFVRPGYTRVDISGGAPSGVELSAYKNPSDGTVVVVAINAGTSSVSVPISIAGGTAPSQVTPWVTSATDNLASKTTLAVSGSSFTATLAGVTVTTFVGK